MPFKKQTKENRTKDRAEQFSLMPTGGLEQPMRFPVLKDLMEGVRQRFDQAKEKRDLRLALVLVEDLSTLGQAAGLGLAQVFYLIYQNWDSFHEGEASPPSFEEEIYAQFGKDPVTVERYIGAWDVIEEAPDDLKPDLMMRPIQDLIAMWQHANAHGPLDDEQYKLLSQQPNTTSVRKALQHLRGDEQGGRELRFVLRKDGTLEVWAGGNVSSIGFIRRDSIDLNDPLRRRGITTLINRLGADVDGIISPTPLKKRERKRKADDNRVGGKRSYAQRKQGKD